VIPGPDGTLIRLLGRVKPSVSSRTQALADARADLGFNEGDELSPICIAFALIKLRVQPEEVSKLLSWREFEDLAAALLRASGYRVRSNVHLTKPRAQLDVVAFGDSVVLSVDCKHYTRQPGPASMASFAKAQLERSCLLRRKEKDLPPIASVILSMSEPEGRFIEGVAVVPVRTLRSFLTTFDSYTGMLDLR
jgi:hypothetical protein